MKQARKTNGEIISVSNEFKLVVGSSLIFDAAKLISQSRLSNGETNFLFEGDFNIRLVVADRLKDDNNWYLFSSLADLYPPVIYQEVFSDTPEMTFNPKQQNYTWQVVSERGFGLGDPRGVYVANVA